MNVQVKLNPSLVAIIYLHLQKIIKVSILQEELGFLVQCLSFLVMESYKAFHAVDDGPPTAVKNLETLIKRWTDAVLTVTVGTAPAVRTLKLLLETHFGCDC